MIDDEKDQNDETPETTESTVTSQADEKLSDDDLDAASGGGYFA